MVDASASACSVVAYMVDASASTCPVVAYHGWRFSHAMPLDHHQPALPRTVDGLREQTIKFSKLKAATKFEVHCETCDELVTGSCKCVAYHALFLWLMLLPRHA